MAQIYKNPGIVFGDLTFDGNEYFLGNIESSEYPVIIGKNAADPSTEANKGKVYTKDVGAGAIELFYLDAAGNPVQITDAGSVVGPGWTTLDDIPDGVTYGKVKNLCLQAGLVKQIIDTATSFYLIPSVIGADRTLTISDNVALNQNLRITDGPTFSNLILNGPLTIGTVGTYLGITPGSPLIEIYAEDITGGGDTTLRLSYLSLKGAATAACTVDDLELFVDPGAQISESVCSWNVITQQDGSIVSTELSAIAGTVVINETNAANAPSGVVAGIYGVYITNGSNPVIPLAAGGNTYFKASVGGITQTDTNTNPHGVFLAMMADDGDAMNAKIIAAAFKAVNFKNVAGSGYAFGLDLYNEPTMGPTIAIADIRLANGNLLSNTAIDLVYLDAEFSPDNLRLVEIATPLNEADVGKVYSKDVTGSTELHYLDDSGNEIQITNLGNLNFSALGITLDDIADGAIYGKVLLTSLTGNEVTKLTDAAGDDLTISLGSSNRILTLTSDVALNQNLRTTDFVEFTGIQVIATSSYALTTVGMSEVSSITYTGTGGAGDNMLTTGSSYTNLTSTKYFVVEIDGGDPASPNTFRWSNDGGGTWEASGISITGLAQVLEDGIQITFGATTGHNNGDKWEFDGYPYAGNYWQATYTTGNIAILNNANGLVIYHDITTSQDLYVTVDANIGRDIYVTRDAIIDRNLYVGGGYGSTGLLVDENGNVMTDGLGVFSDVSTNSAGAYYIGNIITNGSWRIILSGNDLNFERRESGSWVPKGQITA